MNFPTHQSHSGPRRRRQVRFIATSQRHSAVRPRAAFRRNGDEDDQV